MIFVSEGLEVFGLPRVETLRELAVFLGHVRDERPQVYAAYMQSVPVLTLEMRVLLYSSNSLPPILTPARAQRVSGIIQESRRILIEIIASAN